MIKYILFGLLLSGSVIAQTETVWVCNERGECEYITVYYVY